MQGVTEVAKQHQDSALYIFDINALLHASGWSTKALPDSIAVKNTEKSPASPTDDLYGDISLNLLCFLSSSFGRFSTFGHVGEDVANAL